MICILGIFNLDKTFDDTLYHKIFGVSTDYQKMGVHLFLKKLVSGLRWGREAQMNFIAFKGPSLPFIRLFFSEFSFNFFLFFHDMVKFASS